MRVLVFNAGSSSLKYRVIEASAEKRLASGVIEKIGEESGPPDHALAAADVLSRLSSEAAARFDAVAHRIVHGGDRFSDPVVLDEETIAALENLGEIAPLHNARALTVVKACREARPDLPQVGVFDTAFHRTMPERASSYAIPGDLAARHGVRRFGFHGTAFRSLMEKYARVCRRPAGELRLIAFQLGNGASACAIDRGRSVDTSMGFTPLEGLVMGTRSGDLDPALVPYLARREGVTAAEIVEGFNERSGLLGVSGISRDAREVQRAAESGDARAPGPGALRLPGAQVPRGVPRGSRRGGRGPLRWRHRGALAAVEGRDPGGARGARHPPRSRPQRIPARGGRTHLD